MKPLVYVKIQPKEWFEENAFFYNGDWWIDKEHERQYLKVDGRKVSEYISSNDVDSVIGLHKNIEVYEWAVKEFLTKEKYPELFL